MSYSDPRVLVCVLGRELAPLIAAAREFRAPTTFTVDEEFSSDEADDRMERSFAVCWDTVHRGAYEDHDELEVVDHECVLYALSPELPRASALQGGIDAVMFIEHLLARGGMAAKIENAGIAHGADRWRELAAQIRKAQQGADRVALVRAVRQAVAKRPLAGEDYYESLGHHLLGQPEVYVPLGAVDTDRASVAVMDRISDELAVSSVEAVVKRYRATLDPSSQYEGDFEFKINPWGVVQLPDTPMSTLAPSRPWL